MIAETIKNKVKKTDGIKYNVELNKIILFCLHLVCETTSVIKYFSLEPINLTSSNLI